MAEKTKKTGGSSALIYKAKHLSSSGGQRRAQRGAGAAALRLCALPLTVVFLELMLRVCSGFTLAIPAMPGLLLTALGVGLALGFLGGLWRSRAAGEVITVLLAELLTVWYLICYFTNDSYLVFMGPMMVLAEAGNVAGEFSENLMLVIRGGIGYILLFHIPVVLLLVFGKRVFRPLSRRLLLSLASLALGAALIFCGYRVNMAREDVKNAYTSEYDYDSSVRRLGAATAFTLDIYYGTSETGDAEQISFGGAAADAADPTVYYSDPVYYSPDPEPVPETPVEQGTEPGSEADSGDTEPTEHEAHEAHAAHAAHAVNYGYNVINLDFQKLIDATSDPTLKEVFRYASTVVPTGKNQYTGMFEGKNLILITAESFSKEVIDPELTPTLYRMANKGVVFEDFYVPLWAGSTSTGEYEFLMGNIPTRAEAMQKTEGKNLYYTMGNCLQRLGYFSMAYHNGNYDYYSRNRTHTNLGYSQFLAHGNGLDITWQWPASDNEMAQITIDDYIDNTPFSIYYLSISGHFNHTFNGNQMAMRHRDEVEHLDKLITTKAYLAAQLELECMLNTLIEALDEHGILDDTVICICADHYPYGLVKSETYGNSRDYLADLYGMREVVGNLEQYHNQAILWCRELEDSDPVVVSKPTWAADLLPTLLNLFGIEYDSRLLTGRDALAEGEGLAVFADRSWKSDLGYYEAYNGKFYPASAEEGADYTDYVAAHKQTVSNQFAFSKAVVAYDLYGIIFDDPTQYLLTVEKPGK